MKAALPISAEALRRKVLLRHDLLVLVFSGDLLNQVNNGSPEFRVFDAHVGLRQRNPVRCGEEIRYVGRLRLVQCIR